MENFWEIFWYVVWCGAFIFSVLFLFFKVSEKGAKDILDEMFEAEDISAKVYKKYKKKIK